MRKLTSWALVATLLAATGGARIRSQEDDAPRETGKTEEVEVRLVTVDVVVLDRQNRTVPDLGKSDFRLIVDGNPVEVDTLDVECPGGRLEDPRGTRVPGEWQATAPASESPRRVVFALDYLHLPDLPCPEMSPGPCMFQTQVLEQLRATVPSQMDEGDEIMIAALTGGLRVEQPFTDDLDEVLASLERMEFDVTLYSGNFRHTTEFPLFRSLDALMDVLATEPGPKAVVLFSGGMGPGIAYDNEYRALASRASASRVSLYTVDCLGLYGQRFT